MLNDNPSTLSLRFVPLLFMAFGISCNSSDFASSPDKKNTTDKPTNDRQSHLVIDEFAGLGSEATIQKVDIVFAVDTSGSMREEREKLEQNMGDFLRHFTKAGRNLDYQVFMIGSDFQFPGELDGSKFHIIDHKVDSHNSLKVLHQFLSGKLGSAQIRSDAVTEAVVVTDDNAMGDPQAFSDLLSSLGGLGQQGQGQTTNGDLLAPIFDRFWGYSADQFRKIMNNQMPEVKLHLNGFVGISRGRQNSWCNIAAVGSDYIDLAKDGPYKGLIQDLCKEDWASLFQQLANVIIETNRQDVFTLSKSPSAAAKIRVTVDGRLHNEFTFDPAENSIRFHKGAAPANGAKVKVEYESD